MAIDNNKRPPNSQNFALCHTEETLAVVPDKPEQSPHRQFVAVCERKKAPPDKISGGVLFSRARGQYSGNPRRKYLHSATDFLLAEPYPTNYNNHPIQT